MIVPVELLREVDVSELDHRFSHLLFFPKRKPRRLVDLRESLVEVIEECERVRYFYRHVAVLKGNVHKLRVPQIKKRSKCPAFCPPIHGSSLD